MANAPSSGARGRGSAHVPVTRGSRGYRWGAFAALALTLLLRIGPATGQQTPVPQYPVGVGAVALDVLVTDGKGRFVPGLEADEFRVLEDGVPQELSFFTSSRTPVTVILLLDSSASVRSNLVPVQKAAHRFIDKLARGDRACVGYFHERVVFGPRFTDDMEEHSAMINQMRAQRSTHLYDALVQAFERLQPIPKRRALVVFSDGEDQGSEASMEDALDAARRSHVSVYSVGLVGWSADEGMHTNERLLETVSRITGGRAFFPAKDKEMRKAFDRIRAELHNQYRMGYVPAKRAGGSDQWREIRVEVPRRRGLVVRSRLGYFSNGEQAP